MKKLLSILMLSWAFVYGQAQQSVDMDWWREGRFGMFIHWGLYSVAAGEWNGKPVDGIGEWIQNFAKVPNNEYEKLADKLTLAKYNPGRMGEISKASRSSVILYLRLNTMKAFVCIRARCLILILSVLLIKEIL